MEFTACFLGLGNMGAPMAANLLKNHVKLFVYNRSKDKLKTLLDLGASALNSPAEAFVNANIVFSMVANDQALIDITTGENGILKNAKSGCIHVSMSTVSPKVCQDLTAKHREKGVQYLSCPVFGRPDVAEQHKLWICMAGEASAKKRVEPFLKFMGQKIYDFGELPEAANAVKLSGNFLILTIVEALAEAYAFAEKSGVELKKLHTALAESLFPSPVFQTYGNIIINSEYSPAGFKMSLGLKDMDLLLRSAEKVKVPLPIAGLLHDRLMSGLANEREEMDWSAIALTEFEEAGLLHHSEKSRGK